MLKLCVIGDPVGHSLSPMLHREMLQKAGIDGTYEAVTVKPEELTDFVAKAKAGAYDGFNVTMPHKETILPLLDALAPSAREMGAVNTVVVRKGRAIGHNTDGDGLVRSLGALPEKAVVLGNGGAAKAVSHALRQKDVEVVICARHPARGERPWSEIGDAVRDCGLLINATPLGMAGKAAFSDLSFLKTMPKNAIVYDLVYNPRQTKLLQEAEMLCHPTIEGFALLKSQAELAFTIFTE